MKKVFGQYRNWTLLIVPNWYQSKAVWFVIAPGADPKVIHGERSTHEEALVAGRKTLIYEAQHESVSRSDS